LFGSDPAARGGGHLLLAPGMKAVGSWSASSELLLVTVQGLSVPPSCADGRWRLDASVQALACEMRRGLLLEERPPLPYFGYLARAMFVAAVAAAERRPSIRAPRLPRPKLDRVLREIEERLREPLSVEQLASVAGLSRARFAVAFSATIGLSPMAYVRARRLEAVRRGLETGEQDLARLAARCGFSSHAHMTTAFRSAFGLSPSVYRSRFSGVKGRPTTDEAAQHGTPGASKQNSVPDMTRVESRSLNGRMPVVEPRASAARTASPSQA